MSKSQHACARAVGPANTPSRAFGAVLRILSIAAMLACVLVVSTPVWAQKLIGGKFLTTDIADDYRSVTDGFQKDFKNCDPGAYHRDVLAAIRKYKDKRVENRREGERLRNERGSLQENPGKNAKRLGEIARELAHNIAEGRDISTALFDLEVQKALASHAETRAVNGQDEPSDSPFAHCKDKAKRRKTHVALRGFDYIFNIDAGVAFGTMKKIGAGTVGDPGSETSLRSSKGTLDGGFIQFGGEFRLPDWLKGLDEGLKRQSAAFFLAKKRAATLPGGGYQFSPRLSWGVEYGNLGGTNTGREDDRNVAFTFLTPNPATGSTGVNAGNTGEDVSIETRVHMVAAHVSFVQPLAGGTIGEDGVWTVSGEAGAQYNYTWGMHTIDQSSLTFPGLSSHTELTADEHFFAGMLGLSLHVQKGPLYGSVSGSVAPGYQHSRGTAEQNNLCDVCGNPDDRNFTLNLEDVNNSFAVRTGVTVKFGAFLNEHALVGINARYEFTSKMGGFSNPTSPTQQPARFDTNTAHEWSIGLNFKYVF